MASVKDESKNAILPEVNMDKSIYQSFFYIFINEKVYLRKKGIDLFNHQTKKSVGIGLSIFFA